MQLSTNLADPTRLEKHFPPAESQRCSYREACPKQLLLSHRCLESNAPPTEDAGASCRWRPVRHMALREFLDNRGRRWTVWDVYSTLLHRDPNNIGQSASIEEPPVDGEARVSLPQHMRLNWLAFEAHDGEHRRLVPIPTFETRWFHATDQQLCTWCEMAKRVPATRRLIE